MGLFQWLSDKWSGFSNEPVVVGDPPTKYYNLLLSDWLFYTEADKRGLKHPFLPKTWLNIRKAWVYIPDDPKESMTHKLYMDYFAALATQNDLEHLRRAYAAYFAPNQGGFPDPERKK